MPTVRDDRERVRIGVSRMSRVEWWNVLCVSDLLGDLVTLGELLVIAA